MTDAELLERLDRRPFVRVASVGRDFYWNSEIQKFEGDGWRWYDHRGAPGHRGWTKTAGGTLREALIAWVTTAEEIERGEIPAQA